MPRTHRIKNLVQKALRQRQKQKLARLDVAARGVPTILDQLLTTLATQFGKIPDTYLVVDLETSGYDYYRDHILQIGHCLVRNRQVIDRQGFFLDWTQEEDSQPSFITQLQNDIVQLEGRMRAEHKSFHTTWDVLCTQGVAPRAVLEDYFTWFEEIREKDWFLILHNGYNFDCRFLHQHFQTYLRTVLPGTFPYPFGLNNVLDTGVILKASQLNMLPLPNETLYAFSMRVSGQRKKGVRWALSDFAVPLFSLDKKYGLDLAGAHDASWDALATHYLFETLKERAAHKLPVLPEPGE